LSVFTEYYFRSRGFWRNFALEKFSYTEINLFSRQKRYFNDFKFCKLFNPPTRL